MNRYFTYFILLLAIFWFGCDNANEIEIASYQPRLVVEGRIESGDYSSVLLSMSAPMMGPKDTLSLLNHAIKSAKVSVSDGVDTEVLQLQTNYNKIPPYEYKGHLIKGEVGNNYELTVEYNDQIYTAMTYIPEPVAINDVWFEKDDNQMNGYYFIKFRNTTTEYYQVATQTLASEKVYTPCLYGNIDSRLYKTDEVVSIQINKGPVLFPEASYVTSFNLYNPILIKLSTMPKDAYRFWVSFQNEVINTQNPIFPANTSLVSNLQGGAIGIWSGYGVYIVYVDPREYRAGSM